MLVYPFTLVLGAPIRDETYVLLVLLVGVGGQIGGLFESPIKRAVK